MLTKAYSSVVLVVDVLVALVKLVLILLESLYHLVVPLPEKSVNDELVLVTGAGHGIGRELALQFSALGARLVLWDLDAELCENTAREVRAQGGKASSYCCDVTDRALVLETAAKVRRELGPVGILVNNAGIMPCKPLLNHKEVEIRKMFDVNVMAHFWMLEAFLPDMRAHGRGHVVAMSSMAGLMGLVNLVPYCASKYAVRGLMESLAEEIRQDPKQPDIQFTTIFPFIVNTGLVHKPKISGRFPSLLGVISPRTAARRVIYATRRNMREMTIPGLLYHLNNVTRAMPRKVADLVRDLVDSGCEAHDC